MKYMTAHAEHKGYLKTHTNQNKQQPQTEEPTANQLTHQRKWVCGNAATQHRAAFVIVKVYLHATGEKDFKWLGMFFKLH